MLTPLVQKRELSNEATCVNAFTSPGVTYASVRRVLVSMVPSTLRVAMTLKSVESPVEERSRA